ncbi:MAG TPA: autoinducer 2 ABC transporter substrate-binding protein [Acetobacteraceae bacterium]|nr:autoinducer 2 ABC transporter substrate-binding protein [Acetobacteraceae bacterium]
MEIEDRDDRIAGLTARLADGRITRRHWLRAMLALGVSLPAMAELLRQTGVPVGRAAAGEPLHVFNVPKFTGFFFFEQARDGGAKACAELGARQTYVGTTTADVEGQVQVLQNILPQHPDCIVTAALDLNAPVPALRQARRHGAVVVTFDADVAPAGRDLFTNMAPFDIQAKAMLDCALANAPEGGKSIWVAPTPTVANFISQKKAIDEQIATNPKYKSIVFIDTLYANDDPDKSYAVGSSAMQAHPDLKLFISGSGISVPAINKAIEDTHRIGKVFATGFGIPSTMKTYLEHGTCKQYALWSPYKFGYLATYMAILLKSGRVKHEVGTQVDVPTIGHRDIGPGFIINLSQMLFFTKGHDDFPTAIPAVV